MKLSSLFALVFALVWSVAPTSNAQVAGMLDMSYNPNAEYPPGRNVLATAVQPDGKTIVGGSFTVLNGITHPYLARLNTDGTIDGGFIAATDGSVFAATVQADGKILIGGQFSQVNGMARNGFARLNSDGSLESNATFNPGTGATGPGSPYPSPDVFCIALQTDGKILLAGSFNAVNGAVRNYFARLNADGSVESNNTFNPGTGTNKRVVSAVVQADGKILLGGDFTTVNGAVRNYIARLNVDGSVESATTFNPGTGANYTVYGMAVQPDGKILLGGAFTQINGLTRNRIGRLNADGSVESTVTFNPGTGARDLTIAGVAVQADGRILLSGAFTQFNDATHNRIVRLNTDGSPESTATFNPGTGANELVYSVALQADGKILLGGGFTQINGVTRNRIARLSNDAATQSLSALNPTQARWLRGGALPEVEQVTFELSTNGGSIWSTLGAGLRIAGGWQLNGQNLPTFGSIRARGRTTSGRFSSSSGVVEQVSVFNFSAPLREWKLAHLGDAYAPDTGDPDSDGLLTLAEYGLNLMPEVSSQSPGATVFTYAEGQRLRMFVPRDPAHDDITVSVEVTGDLVAGLWTALATSTLGAPFTGPGYFGGDAATPGMKTVEVRDTVNLSSTTRRWLRVKVSH